MRDPCYECVCVYTHTYIHTYIYIERERERGERETSFMLVNEILTQLFFSTPTWER